MFNFSYFPYVPIFILNIDIFGSILETVYVDIICQLGNNIKKAHTSEFDNKCIYESQMFL